MLLDSYYHFNTEEFIRDLKKLRRTRARLVEELQNVSELPAVNNESGIRSSTISDMTAMQANRRMEIQNKIDEIDEAFAVYRNAKRRLSPTEREVIELFFESKKPTWRLIEEYTENNFVCRSNVYKSRRLALQKMDEIIGETYK